MDCHGVPMGHTGRPKVLCIGVYGSPWVSMGCTYIFVMFGDRSMSEYVKAENDESTFAGNLISFNQGGALWGPWAPEIELGRGSAPTPGRLSEHWLDRRVQHGQQIVIACG